MRQLPLALLACAAFAAAAEFTVPCNDDGVAHIPDLPEGQRRPYAVRKRSRTGHRDLSSGSSVTDDTPQLPPGQRRFDAVLPDEQGHDVATSTTARGSRRRGQRRLSEDDNEVAASPQLQRHPVKRPVHPKKVAELNVSEVEHDAKSDAVVDSYEAVRRYPTHLPTEDDLDDDLDDDGNLASNDIAGAPTPLHDQVAQEDVPTASTEQRVESDADQPPGYRSKFPQRTFASDAGGSGDVLRVKPRKHANQYQPPPQHDEQGDVHGAPPPSPRQQPSRPRPAARSEETPDDAPEVPATPPPRRRQPASRPRPAVRREEDSENAPGAPLEPIPATRGPQRYRASHRVRQGSDQLQRSQPSRRRPDSVRADAAGAAEDVAAVAAPQQEEHFSEQRPSRRRLRPRPVTDAPDDNLIPDDGVPPTSTPITPPQEAQVLDVQPQRRPLRRRLRPRPVSVEEAEDVSEVLRQAPIPQRRRRPQAAARTVSEESFSVQSSQDAQLVVQDQQRQRPRGNGRRLSLAPPVQNLPQVEVEHDGTAQDIKTEPTLVRTAVKKVPAGSHGGEPSPALIQKIVKNTLRRLQPQIAEHEGDVGVDILVKIIEVEDD